MISIGGNTTATLQTKSTGTKNNIGEAAKTWALAKTLTGWLDLSSGDSKYTVYSAKIQESTHMFLCDYQDLCNITAESSRLLVDGKVYDVLLIDDPMNLHQQLEIYLKFVGGQSAN
jgi:head-tail adaptor